MYKCLSTSMSRWNGEPPWCQMAIAKASRHSSSTTVSPTTGPANRKSTVTKLTRAQHQASTLTMGKRATSRQYVPAEVYAIHRSTCNSNIILM